MGQSQGKKVFVFWVKDELDEAKESGDLREVLSRVQAFPLPSSVVPTAAEVKMLEAVIESILLPHL